MSLTHSDLIKPLNSLTHRILSGSRHFFRIILCNKFFVEFFLMLACKEMLICLNLSIKLLALMFSFKTPEIMRKSEIFLIISEGIEMEHWNEIGL